MTFLWLTLYLWSLQFYTVLEDNFLEEYKKNQPDYRKDKFLATLFGRLVFSGPHNSGIGLILNFSRLSKTWHILQTFKFVFKKMLPVLANKSRTHTHPQILHTTTTPPPPSRLVNNDTHGIVIFYCFLKRGCRIN